MGGFWGGMFVIVSKCSGSFRVFGDAEKFVHQGKLEMFHGKMNI